MAEDYRRGPQCASRLVSFITKFFDGNTTSESNDGRGRAARLGRERNQQTAVRHKLLYTGKNRFR